MITTLEFQELPLNMFCKHIDSTIFILYTISDQLCNSHIYRSNPKNISCFNNTNGEDLHDASPVRFDTKAEGGPAEEQPETIYNYVRLVGNVQM